MNIEKKKLKKECEEWLKNNYGIEANYNDIDVDFANKNNEAIQKFMEEFPDSEDAVSRVRTMKAKSYAGKYSPKSTTGEPLTGGDLRMSKIHFKNKEAFERLKKNQTEGYAMTFNGFNEQSVMAHELGHSLEYKLAAKKHGISFGDVLTKGKRTDMIRTWNSHSIAENIKNDALSNLGLPKYGKETADEIKKLGSMAVGNDAELLAQGVANYISTDDPAKLANEIVKELKRRL